MTLNVIFDVKKIRLYVDVFFLTFDVLLLNWRWRFSSTSNVTKSNWRSEHCQRVRFKKTNKLTELPIPGYFQNVSWRWNNKESFADYPVYYPGSFGSCYFRICVLSNKRHCWSNGSWRWCSYDVASCRWWNNPKQFFDPAPSRHSRHFNRYVSSCKIRSTSFRDNLNSFTVTPTMTETTALGAAMAAGNAEGIDVWSLDSLDRKRHHHRYIHSGCFWIRYI